MNVDRSGHERAGGASKAGAVCPSPSNQLLELKERAGAGDEGARELLLARLHTTILRFLRRRFSGDPAPGDWIDDAALEALIKIASALESCRATDDRQLVSWALTIARSSALDLIRSELRAAARSALFYDARSARSDIGDETRTASAAEDALFRLVQSVHDELPEKAQVLLWSRLMEGGSWEDIGEDLRTTADGAKRRFQRLQGRLRRDLAKRIHTLSDGDRSLVLDRLASLGLSLE